MASRLDEPIRADLRVGLGGMFAGIRTATTERAPPTRA